MNANAKKRNAGHIETRLAALRARCSECGLRFTPQRREIYREMARACDHPSAETLHKRIARRMPAMTLDTVYRTLGTFEALGFIERVGAVGNSARFEANLAPHHHFVCKRCGMILDVPPGRFDPAEFTRDLPDGSLLHSARIDMRGICSQCARSFVSQRQSAQLME